MSVVDQLSATGDIAPVAPKPKKKSILQFELTKKKVPRKDLMHFSRQLAVFVKAGIPLLDALETLLEEMSHKTFARVVQEMRDDLRGGITFADAAARHPSVFPPYYLGILRSAELTGRLDGVLLQLSDYIERDMAAKRKITSALTYPAVIALMSVVVVAVLTVYVMPKFETFFQDLDAELPLATRLLLGISDVLQAYGLFLLAGMVAAAVLLVVAARTPSGAVLRDRLLLRLPVLGDLIRHAVLERFCRILSSMASAGVPLPDGLAVTADATSNAVFKIRLTEARAKMMRGEGLAAPLAETGLFPGAARQMLRVGESTGTLDQQMLVAAEYFDRELDYKIKRFTDLFEPAVLVTMGLVVGFVAIALVSAMYGIFRQVGV